MCVTPEVVRRLSPYLIGAHQTVGALRAQYGDTAGTIKLKPLFVTST